MAIYSSVLAWEIPWTENPGGLYSLWGHKRVGQDLVIKLKKKKRERLKQLGLGANYCPPGGSKSKHSQAGI